MKNGWYKKGLIIGIITLLVSINITSMVSSLPHSKNVEEINSIEMNSNYIESNILEVSKGDPWAYFEKPVPQGLFIFDIIGAEFPICLIIGKITIKILAGCKDCELDKVELYVDGKVITFYEPPYEYVWEQSHFILNSVGVTAYSGNSKAGTSFPLIRIF